ncbi:hypothetical protein [Pacificispira sp.]|uniref:hypothetical protein n=1 Tax=Pacificispira sp. TaxID=2888761 RepID=UPI003B52CEA3
MPDVIAPTEEAILRALGRFHYLNSKHLLRLGIANRPGPIQESLKVLRERSPSLVRALDFGVLPTVGRLPILYCLTERGAGLLIETGVSEEHAQSVKSSHLFANDYAHRCMCVDLHITLALWCDTVGAELDCYRSYYSRGRSDGTTAKQATALTVSGEQFIPDAVFKFTMPDGLSRLCVFELHNGDDAKRLLRQVNAYCNPAVWRRIEDAYDYENAVRLLLIFEKPKTLQRFRQLAAKESTVAASARRIFAKTHSDIMSDFLEGWEGVATDESRPLF